MSKTIFGVFQCSSCGEERVVDVRTIKRKGNTLCRSCSKKNGSNNDLVGKKFGDLTVVSIVNNKKGRSLAKVKCVCGRFTQVTVHNLRSGGHKTCGMSHGVIERPKHKLRIWSKQVKERDIYCAACGSNEDLMAHHIENYANNPDLRFDLDNGITMCRKCHTDFHCNFMGNYRTPCTKEDFDEYLLQV